MSQSAILRSSLMFPRSLDEREVAAVETRINCRLVTRKSRTLDRICSSSRYSSSMTSSISMSPRFKCSDGLADVAKFMVITTSKKLAKRVGVAVKEGI